MSSSRVVVRVLSAAASLGAGLALLFSCTVMNGYRARLDGGAVDPTEKDGRAPPGGDDDDKGDGQVQIGPKCDPSTPFSLLTPLSELDTSADEELPRISFDERSLYFFVVLGDSGATAFKAERDERTKPFGTPSTMLTDVFNARQVAPTPDHLHVYFAAGPEGAYKLFVADRTSAAQPFTNARAILQGAAAEAVSYPAIFNGPQGPKILYVKQTVAGDGTITTGDIWSADVQPDGTLANPVGLQAVNTPSLEYDPTPSPDGLTLYFYSEHDLALNGGRVWIAQRPSVTEPFGTPRIIDELQPPQGGYVSPAGISPDLCRLYFYSADKEFSADMFVASRTP